MDAIGDNMAMLPSILVVQSVFITLDCETCAQAFKAQCSGELYIFWFKICIMPLLECRALSANAFCSVAGFAALLAPSASAQRLLYVSRIKVVGRPIFHCCCVVARCIRQIR